MTNTTRKSSYKSWSLNLTQFSTYNCFYVFVQATSSDRTSTINYSAINIECSERQAKKVNFAVLNKLSNSMQCTSTINASQYFYKIRNLENLVKKKIRRFCKSFLSREKAFLKFQKNMKESLLICVLTLYVQIFLKYSKPSC